MPRYFAKKIIIVAIAVFSIVTPLKSEQKISPNIVAGLPISNINQEQVFDIQAGVDALNTGQWLVANRIFTQLTKTMPKTPIVWIGQSITAETMEQKTAALDSVAKLSANASKAEKLLFRIETASIEGNLKEQLTLSKQLIDTYPESSWAWIQYGYTLQENRKIEQSRKAFETAATMSANNVAALLASGNSYIFSEPKDIMMAEIYFKQAAALRPTSAWIQINLGDVHRAQLNLNSAKNDYTRASWLVPNAPLVYSKKGHVNSFLGNYQQANQDFDNSAKFGGDTLAWFNSSANFKAFINLYDDKPEKALQALSKHLSAIDKSDFSAAQKNQAKLNTLSNMSQIALFENLLPQAKNYIENRGTLIKTLVSKVNDEQFSRRARAQMYFLDGQLQLKQGKINLALQSADKMSLLLGSIGDVKKYEEVNELKALISMKKEQYQQAISYFNKADQDKLMVKYHKVLALEQIGETRAAVRLLTDVSNYNFNSVEFAILRNKAAKKLSSMSVAMVE